MRKAYWNPHGETLIFFELSLLKFSASLFALRSHSVTTCLFPASVICVNVTFIATLLVWRRSLQDRGSVLHSSSGKVADLELHQSTLVNSPRHCCIDSNRWI